MYLINPCQGSSMKPGTMLSPSRDLWRQSNPPPICPNFPGMKWNAEKQAIMKLPVSVTKAEYVEAIDDVYFSLYPNAPQIPEGWESHPACAPWVDTWLRLYGFGERIGKYQSIKPMVPQRIRRRRGKTTRTTGRYGRIAKMLGV